MLALFLFQAATTTSTPTVSPWVTTGGLVIAYAASELWKLRGQRKHTQITKQERNEELDRRLKQITLSMDLAHQTIRDDIGGLANEVRDLKSHVIGPDGQNGIRGEVRALKHELEELAPRRRRRA